MKFYGRAENEGVFGAEQRSGGGMELTDHHLCVSTSTRVPIPKENSPSVKRSSVSLSNEVTLPGETLTLTFSDVACVRVCDCVRVCALLLCPC